MTSERSGDCDLRRPLIELAGDRVRVMLGCYPHVQVGDPETYTAALVSVLVRYSEEVVIGVTEPATGLPSRLKWPPTVAELVEACEALCRKEPAGRRWGDAVRETLDRRRDPASSFPRLVSPAPSEDGEYAEFCLGRRGRGTVEQRTRHIGEVLSKHGWFDLAKKFGGP